MHKELFKKYFIEGEAKYITPEFAYWTGYAFVKDILQKGLTENKTNKVIVAHDQRASSPIIYKFLSNGLKDAGAEIIPIGYGSIDLLYAATQLYHCSGIIISSCNSNSDHSGIKFVKSPPHMLGQGKGLEILENSAYINNLQPVPVSGYLNIAANDSAKTQIFDYYTNRLNLIGEIKVTNEYIRLKPITVVVDAGNGITGYVLSEIFEKLYPDIHFIKLNWDVSTDSPNHPADPSQNENVVELQEAIKTNNAAFGVAFDNDGDKVYFFDENAERIEGDYVVATFAKYILKEYHEGRPSLRSLEPIIVYSIPVSRCVRDTIVEMGGVTAVAKQDHNHLKEILDETKGLYAGEHNGHHYFAEFGFMDSGIMATALFIEILQKDKTSASDLVKEYRDKYILSGEINLPIPEGQDPIKFFEYINTLLQHTYLSAEIDYLDGINIFYPDWKFCIRLGNTENVLRLSVEVRRGLINQTPTNTPRMKDVEDKVTEIKTLIGIT